MEQFGSTTPELESLVSWLQERNVESVAMDSPRLYWIAPHEVDERTELEVFMCTHRWWCGLPGRHRNDRGA